GRRRRLALQLLPTLKLSRCWPPSIRLAPKVEEMQMDDGPCMPQPPIFNLNAYSPAEIKQAVEKIGVKKIRLPLLASFMLAIVGGGSVGLGALYYTIVASDEAMSFAAVRLLGGLTFSLG